MKKIRPSILAGAWYPGNPAVLKRDILAYLKAAPDVQVTGEIKGLIVPHAGYVYSGSVAAHAYRLVNGRSYDAVIVIGPSHRYAFAGVAVYPRGGFETPLGVIPVHEELADCLVASSVVTASVQAHAQEHSVEIQLPFLQVALGEFSFVGLVMGQQTASVCRDLSCALYEAIEGRNVLMIASSDLSHFHDASSAKRLDAMALKHVERNDTEGLLASLADGKAEACGGGPMAVVLMTASRLGAKQVRLLKYAHSGDVSGDHQSVVGYAAAVCYR